MSIAGIRTMIAMNWTTWTTTNLKYEIDRAKDIGLNCLSLLVWKKYIVQYRTAATDPLKDVMAYAAQQGIRIQLLVTYGNGTDYGGRETFWQNPTMQTAFINDFKWVIARYPTAWGYDLEEPHRYGTDAATAAACRTALNAFFVKCKALIPAGKTWGFNTASSYSVNMMNQGIDIQYINNNKIFDHYTVQAGNATLSGFVGEYNQVKGYFPNLEILAVTYNIGSGSVAQPGCKDAAGNVQWSNPACYYSAFLDQLTYCKNNNIPLCIFRSEVLKFSRSIFPNYPNIAGATVADMVKTVLGGASPTPPPSPPPQPTVETDPTKIVMALAGVGGLLYILDKEI